MSKYLFIFYIFFLSCSEEKLVTNELITVCDHLQALNEISDSIKSSADLYKNENLSKRNKIKLEARRLEILQSFNDKSFKLSDSINCSQN